MRPSPRIESIQVGRPQQHGDPAAQDPMERLWTTAFYKTPVAGPVYAWPHNLEGDGQADLEVHGGPDKAICVYASAHYAYWRAELGLSELPPGAFGENFTVADLVEDEVCVGDTWRVGEATVVQVSQPRQPCWKLARRWRIKTLTLLVQQTGKTGWYFRVLKPGRVAPGDRLALVERRHPLWTVARANRVMHHDKADVDAARALADLSELSESWRANLTQRVRQAARR